MLERLRKQFDVNKVYIVTIIVICVIVILAFFSPEKTLFLVDKPVYELNTPWTVSTQHGTYEDVKLPYRFAKDERSALFTASTRLPKDLGQGQSLLIRASMQDITVYINDEVIFENKRDREGLLTYPEVSMWHLITLPVDAQGQQLRLEYYSQVNVFQGVINEVRYGTGDALVFAVMDEHLIGLIVAGFMMLIGLIVIVASFFLKNLGDQRLFYLGGFSIGTSIWMISEMRVLQWVTGNRFILGGISYLMIALFPLALIRYLEVAVLSAYKKAIDRFVRIFYILFWGTLVLQMLGVVPFIQSALVVNGVMGVSIIWIGLTLVFESFVRRSRIAKKYFMYYSVLLMTGFIEIIFFFSQDFDKIMQYNKIGFALFLTFQFIETVLYVKNLLIIQNEANYLEQMAYQDALTKAKNRAAYEKELDRLLLKENTDNFRLVLADINQLKIINDTYGHTMGDAAIIACYECLVIAFGDMGSCYRLGGDEFACLLIDIDQERFINAKKHFYQLVDEVNLKCEYPFSVALGHELYPHTTYARGENFGEFFHCVDTMMYDMKAKMKC